MKTSTRLIFTVVFSLSLALGLVQIQPQGLIQIRRFPPPSEMGMNLGDGAIWFGITGMIIIVGQIILPALISSLVSRSKRLASK